MRRLVAWPCALLAAGLGGLGAVTHQRTPGDSPTAPASTFATSLLPGDIRAAVPAPLRRLTRLTDPRPGGPREFYFTRAIYSDFSRGYYRGGRWAVDYPKADIQFLIGLRRLTNIDAYEFENAVALDDPDLRKYPFLYALEVGYMSLTEPEVRGLRDYLMAGGFLMVDDFWGSQEWYNFQMEIQRVLPGRSIVDLPLDHPVFHSFYNIDEIHQVPNVRNGRMGGPTYERDGYVPQVRAIFDDDGRLMVGINWNTDLGDAWEWADDPYYPLRFSTYAYEMGVNFIVYAMTH